MSKYTHHSLALTDNEQGQFEEIKKRTGFGVKKIFMAMINALKVDIAIPTNIIDGDNIQITQEEE